MNFSRNTRCLKCKTEGPKRVGADEIEMKKGDWNCLQCNFMNFASNRTCLRCREARPKRQLSPGDWECPSSRERGKTRSLEENYEDNGDFKIWLVDDNFEIYHVVAEYND
ncbi:hypothetical protein U1Q18_045107 [Sarracenia purpurea var. burkii]